MTRLRRARALATVAAVLALQGPASATDVGAADGTGTYRPGLAVGCAFQTVTFSGTMALVGDHAGIYPFAFVGSSHGCDTLVSGSGSGTVSGGITGTLHYSQTGSHVTYSGALTVRGVAMSVLAWHCIRSYTSASPVMSYADHCHLVLG